MIVSPLTYEEFILISNMRNEKVKNRKMGKHEWLCFYSRFRIHYYANTNLIGEPCFSEFLKVRCPNQDPLIASRLGRRLIKSLQDYLDSIKS